MVTGVKVRFGFTVGPDVGSDAFPGIVDELERLKFDSVWIPEVLLQPTLDPIVALTFAAARTKRLKLGSHLIIPGKNPVLLARQLAHLDRLSNGRLLVVGVLGLPDEAETGAQILDRSERSAALAEVVPLLRRLWSGEAVDHAGPHYRLSGVRVTPTPVQQPLEIWLAGQVPGALRRCGELGDGWMPGLLLPAEAAALRAEIEQAAHDAGRSMDPEHYGVNLNYANAPLPHAVAARLAARRTTDSIDDLIPIGMSALRERVDEWLAAGFSKFLLRPVVPPSDWTSELEMLAREILPSTT
jgi:probable F420-dependent oxidoreductase